MPPLPPLPTLVLLVTNLVLLGAVAILYHLFRRYQRRYHQAEGRLPGPVPTVRLAELHPLFETTELGPTPAAEVRFIGRGDGTRGSTSDKEAWVLAVLATRAHRMFEFGTCTGRTTYLWARNSPPDATVATITLGPDQHDLYSAEPGDRAAAARRAVKASAFDAFLYQGTEVEPKVEQLLGDSKAFDETPWLGRCDLIFVDGSHAYSYVKSDSEKALRMLAPGGLLLWHDYDPLSANTRGVWDYLNELRERLPLVHLKGTSLVAYRAPDAG